MSPNDLPAVAVDEGALPLKPAYLVLAAAGLLLVALGYIVFTSQVCDDYFIQLRYARNLAGGHGLTYMPGERVQGFSSVLGVLVPAVVEAMGEGHTFEPGLWTWRLLNLTGLAGGALLLMLAMRSLRGGEWLGPVALAVLLALDAKTIAFTTNGGPAGLTLLFLVLGLVAIERGLAQRWLWYGLAGAGLLYTRSEGLLYILGLGVAGVLLTPSPRRPAIVGAAKGLTIALVGFLPWLIFAWSYFGSPIPHTWTATAGAYHMGTTGSVGVVGAFFTGIVHQAAAVFEPAYAFMGGWPAWVRVFGVAATILTLACGLLPATPRLGRVAAVAYIVALLWLGFVEARNGMVHPAAYPPAVALAIVAIVTGLPGLLRGIGLTHRPDLWLRSAQAGLAICFLALAMMSWVQAGVIQKEITDGIYKQLGLLLAQHAKPGQSIFAEAAGPIGYHANLPVIDWPGVTSRQLTQIRCNNPTDQLNSLAQLRPDWIVLPTSQIEAAEQIRELRLSYTQNDKELLRINAELVLKAYDQLPGFPYVAHHADYTILCQRPAAAAKEIDARTTIPSPSSPPVAD